MKLTYDLGRNTGRHSTNHEERYSGGTRRLQ